MEKTILIIGGGVAGLSAGITARQRGYRTVVCEKNGVAGGNLSGWQRRGYTIDNCIHWFTGSNPASSTYAMWKGLGILDGASFYQSPTLYTSELDGESISLNVDAEKTIEDMIALSPVDTKEIVSLFKAVMAIQSFSGLSSTEEKTGILDYIKNTPSLVKYLHLSIGELTQKFQHPLLKCFLSDLMDEHFSSVALVFTYATFCERNGALLVGGSRAAAQRMAWKFLDLGGILRLNKEAEKVNFQGNRAVSVTFQDGEEIEADYIVSATDPEILFKKLTSLSVPKSLKRQYRNPKYIRFSSYQCAFALDDVPLPFTKQLVFDVPQKYKGLLSKDRLIVYEYSHEKSFAPEGKRILQTMMFCLEDECRLFCDIADNKEAYERKKRRISDIIACILKEKFPVVANSLELIDMWTPATYRKYTGSRTGSYMAFIFPHNTFPFALDNKVKGVKNLYLASQWLQSPGGLPLAAAYGKKAIEVIDKAENAERIEQMILRFLPLEKDKKE